MKTKLAFILFLAVVILLLCGCMATEQQRRDVVIKYVAKSVSEQLPELWNEYCGERWDCVISYAKERLKHE